jgi:hypothetical protein
MLYCVPIQTFFSAVDRCLSFEYVIGNVRLGVGNSRLNVYREGNGAARTNIRRIERTTNNAWQNVSICIEAIEDLKVIVCKIYACLLVKMTL